MEMRLPKDMESQGMNHDRGWDTPKGAGKHGRMERACAKRWVAHRGWRHRQTEVGGGGHKEGWHIEWAGST